ncbi:MAG TPA: UvrD-helicase domain-containing protein, partial [Capillimicrobium sp.]
GAFVSTIHGFCSRLLRAHPLAAGLDPGFAVLDEPRAARLREEAFSSALRGFLDTGGDEALDLAAAYRADGLQQAIVNVYDELRSQGQSDPRLPRVAPRLPPDAERADLAAARAALAAELAEARGGRLVEEARAALDRCERFLGDVEAGIVPWPGRLKALEITTGRASVLSTEGAQAYVDAHEAFRQACADHHAARHVALLDGLLARYGAAYAAAKAARGALDFDDLELRARALLRDHPAVRAAWRERFALVMVDEFQDTNRRQLELVRAIEADNVFTVGDEFQSIYGFRHADVDIFRDRRGALAERGLALRLEESFRSRPEILAAVNAAFAPRFGEHFAPLRAGREHPPADAPAVELLVTDTRGWDEPAGAADDAAPVDLGDSLPPVPAWRRAEARLLAQRLRELVDAGEASPGDMAVLVRASGSMPVLEQALADVGLPTLASAGRGFWTRQEVVDLMGYLAALANPLDEPALLVALGSPLCGLSSDAVALAVRAAREAGTGLWRALRDDRGPWRARLAPADAARLEAFAERFAAERAGAASRGLDELLERAILASGYDTTILGLVGGARRMANVDKLLRLARGYEAAEGRDLRGFVDHAAALEEAQKREPEAPVDDPEVDAVRLMTVHAAKGLEFDVVAVADLGRKPNLSSSTLIVDGDRVGLRLTLLDGARSTPSLHHRRLEEERRAREAAEEERILYVALTRARRRLLLSGATDRWTNGTTAAPLTWLGPALVPDLPARFDAAGAEG